MKVIDISWPLTENTTEYKNKGTIKFQKTKIFENDSVRDSIITLGSHTGTHIDAPSHFLDDGEDLESVPLEKLIGDCKVLDFTSVTEKVTASELEKHKIEKGDIILLKTKNSFVEPDAVFNPEFIYLEKSGADYLVSKGVLAVGIDYLGIERNQPAHETHVTLLGQKVAVIEGLRLGSLPGGSYALVCLPLAIRGLEAAPARAIVFSK